ncbi:succinate--CoA ligase [GDP-forming] subunit beta, mitochondrial [Macrosteles quadrilineatus]|uniref:succinate--CoA ligase [GDP-forming] subunit beta, mitochondrial n=1 Tax=Macrosteles quadrilineatus TaxID=74068 RepID=UPI0023E1CE16|nr:succinate--CoA ligase [GDP-forming] subunit beta, mitochondrial [Macrosteles quadrilineatus]
MAAVLKNSCKMLRWPRLLTNSNSQEYKQIRHLNLLECHSKNLLQNFGVSVQKFEIVENEGDLKNLKTKFKVDEYVIKAMILAGGRGLGHFDNGFKGGVHLTKDPEKLEGIVSKMVGHRLITKQTPKDGILVKKVMVAESVNIHRETYFCILMDRQSNGPVIVASPAGGTDIENVAEKTPELIGKYPIDIFEGISQEKAEEIAKFLKFEGPLVKKAAKEILQLWKMFLSVDAVQVEINPLVETNEGEVVAVDAKIQFDDNAEFRQKDIFAFNETSEMDPREVEAAKSNLNYVGLDGNIGCLVNGAGLAMATMDIIKLHGGEPANFLDVGGGVTENQVLHAFKILTSDSNVKSILVNVFGGIVNCGIIAKGIVNATKSLQLQVPLVVRLEGTNVEEGRKILKESGLKIEFAADFEQAAQKAVASLRR